jgi:hypothetical protein
VIRQVFLLYFSKLFIINCDAVVLIISGKLEEGQKVKKEGSDLSLRESGGVVEAGHRIGHFSCRAKLW